MRQEQHQASRLGTKANTASESSQVTITSKKPTQDYDHHTASPSRSPPLDLGRPPSPPPLPTKDRKRKHATKLSAKRNSPKQKLLPLPKVPHKNLPIRPYDRTDEEIAAIAKAEKDAHFAKKKTEPTPVYTEKQIAWGVDFLSTKSQYELHHKPDDYARTLRKEAEKNKSSKSASGSKASESASGSKASKSASGKRRDVPQLGEQAKQSIPPLKVLSKDVPQAQQQDLVEAAKLAAAMGVTVAELLGSQDDKLPMADVAPTYVPGKPLVNEQKLKQLPTQM